MSTCFTNTSRVLDPGIGTDTQHWYLYRHSTLVSIPTLNPGIDTYTQYWYWYHHSTLVSIPTLNIGIGIGAALLFSTSSENTERQLPNQPYN